MIYYTIYIYVYVGYEKAGIMIFAVVKYTIRKKSCVLLQPLVPRIFQKLLSTLSFEWRFHRRNDCR